MAISVHDAYTMRKAVLYEDEKGQRLMILWPTTYDRLSCLSSQISSLASLCRRQSAAARLFCSLRSRVQLLLPPELQKPQMPPLKRKRCEAGEDGKTAVH